METRDIKKQIDDFVDRNKEQLVADIAQLIAVPSELGEPSDGAPFGTEPRKALDVALGIAQRFGLQTNHGEGYVGWAELPGISDDYLATITHVDIVPPGDGWEGDPFELRAQDGWLIGRGTVDDKGATVLCLYLAKFFQECNIPLKYGLRILVGCNEESGMEDVKYYLRHQPQPLFCFSPDAFFPVCNGEKGHFGGVFCSSKLEGNILEFNVGSAPNVIPGSAECTLRAKTPFPTGTDRVTVEPQDDGQIIRLTAHGIGGHAAMPEDTLNAIGVMIDFLLENNLCSQQEAQALSLFRLVHISTYGDGLGIESKDETFGKLTINGGVIYTRENRLYQSIDIRYPTSTNGEKIEERLKTVSKAFGVSLDEIKYVSPFLIPTSSATIRALMEAFADVTGKGDLPFTMGGGTYARHFENAVSFGPIDGKEEVPSFVGPEHGANEGISEKSLLEALKIYILAVCKLQSVDFHGAE